MRVIDIYCFKSLLGENTDNKNDQSYDWANETGYTLGILSETFQDAITLIRQLRVQYIWIDSLCIVQDDRYDWETESATMAAVYQNAYLTIAASLAADGSGGCLSTRETTTHFAGFLNDAAESRNCSVYVRESFFHDEFYTDNTGTATLSNPVLGRAWTSHERGLSTRIFHFGRVELLWECRTTKACKYAILWAPHTTQFIRTSKESLCRGWYLVLCAAPMAEYLEILLCEEACWIDG